MRHLASSGWLLTALAVQNLGRRKGRTSLLIAAVAISSAVAFAGIVVMRSISASMEVGLSRIGADLMVVPQRTLTNISTALLTVEPTDQTIPADTIERAGLAGIASASAQRIFRTDKSGFGGQGELVDLIGFEPNDDFTVQPWLAERLGRAMQPADVIVGAARNLPLGSELIIFGTPFRVYGKLGHTGSGTHERGVFMQSSSLLALAPAIEQRVGHVPPMLDPGKVSGFLIQIAPGAKDLQLRFALLSKAPDVKVIAGASLLTGIRQGLSSLLGGAAGLVALLSLSTAVMVAVLFSAIVAERRRELGLLKALGARRLQIVGMTVAEAAIATAGGGALGVLVGILVLRIFERTLVFHLDQMGVPFLWLDRLSTISIAAICIAGAALVGFIGAMIPAWHISRREPYDLISSER
jgi:putative ABC transport system permease protein